jgi:hypothetical protein
MKRFGWLIIPWALFAVVVVGWLIYWNMVASSAEQRIAAWVQQQRAGGAQVSYQHMARHGFPVLMRLEIDGISYAPAHGGWRLETSRADLNIEMLNPQHVIVQPKAPIAIVHGDNAVTNVSAHEMIISVRTEGDALAQAGIEADDLRLDDPKQPGVLTVTKVVANVRPDPRAAGDYQLAFVANGLALPRPVRSFESFGLNVPLLRANIVVGRGDALMQSAQSDPLKPWLDAGGKLTFDALQIQWGPLDVTGTGDGGLDDQRRLSGRLVLPIKHPAPVLAAIAEGPELDQSARRALQLLAAGYVISHRQLTLHVEAQNGVMTLEGLRVRDLPPVY